MMLRRGLAGFGGAQKVFVEDLLHAYYDLMKIKSLDAHLDVVDRPLNSSREIFANNEVHLDQIEAYGFDFDYTLASYKNELQRLIYRQSLEHLVDAKCYPKELYRYDYDKTFPIRGLTFDKERGLLFKLGPNFKVDITSVYRGREKLDEEDALRAFGGNQNIRSSSSLDSLRGMFDQFSLAEACLLADVVHYFNVNKIHYSPEAVFEDVFACIGHVHVSFKLHNEVMRNVENYFHKSPKIKQLLEQMREANRQTFLLSNSPFFYIDKGMTYITEDKNWMNLFDVIISDASKPKFYSGRNMFRKVDMDQPRRIAWDDVSKLEPNSVYCGGNSMDLMRMMNWNQPHRVLYFGDHMFTDLETPAKKIGWATGAIIRELEHETATDRTAEYGLLTFKIQVTEEVMRRMQWAPMRNKRSDLTAILDELEHHRAKLRKEMDQLHNKSFGSVFTSSSHGPSLFTFNMQRYCDIYTARLENFLEYGLNYRFYPRRRKILTHEIQPPSVTKVLAKTLNANIDKRDVTPKTELSFRADE